VLSLVLGDDRPLDSILHVGGVMAVQHRVMCLRPQPLDTFMGSIGGDGDDVKVGSEKFSTKDQQEGSNRLMLQLRVPCLLGARINPE